MRHHIRRNQGCWEVWMVGRYGKQLLAASPHGIMDAWEKACDVHGRLAAMVCELEKADEQATRPIT
jgi:hypothetical protein